MNTITNTVINLIRIEPLRNKDDLLNTAKQESKRVSQWLL